MEEFSRVIRLVWTYLATGEGREEAQAAWDAASGQSWFPERLDGPPMMDREILLQHPRMTHYVAHSIYDPVPVLETLRAPMLALFGELDAAVPIEASIKAMRDAFGRGGNSGFTWRIVPGAGHGIPLAAPIGAGTQAAQTVGDFVVDWAARQVIGRPEGDLQADDRPTFP